MRAGGAGPGGGTPWGGRPGPAAPRGPPRPPAGPRRGTSTPPGRAPQTRTAPPPAEKQGGADERANTARAVPAGRDGYLLTGHKWFCSAPMCDLFLVLAQATEGLTCFLLPRVLPDGTRNAMRLQRLKDKLGNRSNASSEVEYDAAFAWRGGEPGRGGATIIEMVTATRLDCVLGSAAAMRQAVGTAVHHARTRRSFGAELISHPLMASVLADLALESEAATTLAMRLAGAAARAGRGRAGGARPPPAGAAPAQDRR